MARWEVSFALERLGGIPLFQQIASAITKDIKRGRLRPGDALPGTRSLARALSVQRMTVMAAFDELVAEGWIVNQPARGAFVSNDLPDIKPQRFTPEELPGRMASRTAFDLLSAPDPELPIHVPRGGLLFAPSRPDVRLAPGKILGRAVRRAMSTRPELLSYANPEGHPRLRRAIAEMLVSTRGLAVGPENICITRGSQMALSLIAGSVLRPGDVVAVEELGYRSAWEAFRQTGAKLIGVPLDKDGLQVQALERALKSYPVRAVYVTPHHQFPTTVTMSAGRRLKLLDLARAHRVAIIEDDYDHEFHYDGRPVLPLASADRFGAVVYVGTFSKVLAPALRIGYVAAPVPLIERIAAHRSHFDTQGDQVLEYVVGGLLEEGEIQRHIRRVRREYRLRRDTLVEALRKHLGHRLSFEVPAGGIALWVHANGGVNVDEWAVSAIKEGVVVVPGRTYAFDGHSKPFLRLGFASLDSRELQEGVRRLATCCPELPRNCS
jgi:GntR family transcriptional regulator / MocR family aminotransferase